MPIHNNPKHLKPIPIDSAKLTYDIDGNAMSISFTGTGNDDLSVPNYDDAIEDVYTVKIDSINPDKFRWRSNSSSTWSFAEDITGGVQELDEFVSIQFGSTTGHVVDDDWDITFNATEDEFQLLGADSQCVIEPITGGNDSRIVLYKMSMDLYPLGSNIANLKVSVGKANHEKITYIEIGLKQALDSISTNHNAKIVLASTDALKIKAGGDFSIQGNIPKTHIHIEAFMPIDFIEKNFFIQNNWSV
jgi:hypothetical protein